jgi:hypothetical protein
MRTRAEPVVEQHSAKPDLNSLDFASVSSTSAAVPPAGSYAQLGVANLVADRITFQDGNEALLDGNSILTRWRPDLPHVGPPSIHGVGDRWLENGEDLFFNFGARTSRHEISGNQNAGDPKLRSMRKRSGASREVSSQVRNSS